MIKRTHLSENFKRTSTRKQNHGAPDLKGFSPLGGTKILFGNGSLVGTGHASFM